MASVEVLAWKLIIKKLIMIYPSEIFPFESQGSNMGVFRIWILFMSMGRSYHLSFWRGNQVKPFKLSYLSFWRVKYSHLESRSMPISV